MVFFDSHKTEPRSGGANIHVASAPDAGLPATPPAARWSAAAGRLIPVLHICACNVKSRAVQPVTNQTPRDGNSRRYAFPALCILVLAAALLFSVFPVASEDIWWHLKLGELILSNHAFSTPDQLVHTVPSGTRFHDTQWLFQLLAYTAFKLAAWNGVVAFRTLQTIALAALLLAWLRKRGTAILPMAATALFTLLLITPRINDRPELISFLAMGAQLWLLDAHLRGRRLLWPAYLAVQLIWGNCHSSVVLGIALPLVFGVVLWLQSVRKHATAGEDRATAFRLVRLAVAAAAISLCNPSGWIVLTYGFTESAKSVILEFGPPWKSALFAEGIDAMALAAYGAWRFAAPRQRWPWVVWGAICAIEYLRMVRFLPYAALSWVPLLASGFSSVLHFAKSISVNSRPLAVPKSKAVAVVLQLLCVLILALVAVHTLYALSLNRRYGNAGVDFSAWPVGAADYVLQNQVPGKIFNGFNEGGYLVWRFAPARQVFMFNETRLNAGTLKQGEEIHTPQGFRDFLDQYGVTYAIVTYTVGSKKLGPLTSWAEVFRKFNDWVPVFWDDTAMVWLKDIPQNHALIARDRCVVNPESIPSRNNARTDLREFMELKTEPATWQSVRPECERLENTPRHFKASFALGLWNDAAGTTPTLARDAYERALALDPAIPELLSRLGQWHLKWGTPAEAIDCFQMAVACATSWPDAMFNLAVAQKKVGQTAQARVTLDAILQKQPQHQRAAKMKSKLNTPQ